MSCDRLIYPIIFGLPRWLQSISSVRSASWHGDRCDRLACFSMRGGVFSIPRAVCSITLVLFVCQTPWPRKKRWWRDKTITIHKRLLGLIGRSCGPWLPPCSFFPFSIHLAHISPKMFIGGSLMVSYELQMIVGDPSIRIYSTSGSAIRGSRKTVFGHTQECLRLHAKANVHHKKALEPVIKT